MKWIFLKTADRTDMLRQMKLPDDAIDYLLNVYPRQLDPKLHHIVWLGKQLLEQATEELGSDPRKKLPEDTPQHIRDTWELKAANAWRSAMIEMRPPAIGEVLDWVFQTRPDLMKMIWGQARDAAAAWHEELSQQHEVELTKHYTDPSKIVFRISNGWTINRLDADDCEMEGDLMGHCVGGYARAVGRGITQIYSLRDPKGEPHATIEMRPESENEEGEKKWLVTQIQGKQNREPIKEYKEMLKSWFDEFEAGGDSVKWEYDEDPPAPEQIRDYEPPVPGARDAYGILLFEEDSYLGASWFDMIERAWNESWSNRGSYYNDSYAEDGIDAVLKNFEYNIRDKGDELKAHTFDELEKAAYKLSDKAQDDWQHYLDQAWDALPHLPDEDDYTDEDGNFDADTFQEAEKKYYEDIGEYEKDFPYFKFTSYLFEKLNAMRERFHPKTEEVEVPAEEPVMATWYSRYQKIA